MHDESKWQLNAIDKQTFIGVAAKKGFSEAEATNVWAMFEGTVWNRDEMLEKIGSRLPLFKELDDLWEKTPLQKMQLTTVGIALAHANARRVGGMDADLSIWIK